MNTISERVWQSDQSWFYDHKFITKAGTRLQVDIRRNAYDHQSWAHGFVFDPGSKKWNLIVSWPITSCHCYKISYVHSAIGLDDFAADNIRMTDEMLAILGEH